VWRHASLGTGLALPPTLCALPVRCSWPGREMHAMAGHHSCYGSYCLSRHKRMSSLPCLIVAYGRVAPGRGRGDGSAGGHCPCDGSVSLKYPCIQRAHCRGRAESRQSGPSLCLERSATCHRRFRRPDRSLDTAQCCTGLGSWHADCLAVGRLPGALPPG